MRNGKNLAYFSHLTEAYTKTNAWKLPREDRIWKFCAKLVTVFNKSIATTLQMWDLMKYKASWMQRLRGC